MNLNNRKVQSVIVVVLWILLFTIWALTIKNSNSNLEIESAKEQLIEASKPTEIEFLKQMKAESKEDVAFKKGNVEMFERSLESAKKEFESAVWLDRCIETKAILLLSGTGSNNVDCTKNLNKFASYNLYQTRIDLGL